MIFIKFPVFLLYGHYCAYNTNFCAWHLYPGEVSALGLMYALLVY